MKKQTNFSSNSEILRQKAEELLKKKKTKKVLKLTEVETLRLIHELEVHQIELEMQYNELEQAKARAAELAGEKYAELYDLAPSGYFTLSREGEILELNLCGSQMLGKERKLIRNSLFGFFVSEDTRPTYNLFLEHLFSNKTKETCDLTLSVNETSQIYVHLAGILIEKGDQCLITAVDITKKRQAEDDLRHSEKRLRTITENAPNIILEVDRSGIIVFISKVLPGYQMKEVIGSNFCNWTPPEYHDEMMKKLNSVFTAGIPQSFQIRGLGENGEMRGYLTSISPVKVDDIVVNAIVIATDITDQIQSEERHSAILQTAMDGFWIMDMLGYVLEVNNSYCQMSGYSKNELLSMNVSRLEAVENVDDISSHIKERIDQGKDLFETRHRRKDGNIFDVEISTQFRPVEGHFVSFIRDITKRKKTEESLANNERLLRESQAAAQIGSYSADLINKTWTASPEMYKIFGINEHHPKTMEAWIMSLHPDFREELVNEVFQVEGKKADLDREFKIVRICDNVERWVHGFGEFEYDNQMNPIRLIGTIQDITKRKQTEELLIESEQRYHSLFEESNDAIFLVDLMSDRYIDCNRLAETLTGYKREEILHMKTGAFLPPQHNEEIASYMEVVLSGEVLRRETEISTKGGNLIPVEFTSSLVTIDKKQCILSLLHDISARRTAEKALKQLNEELEERIKERTGELLTSNETLRLTEEKYRTVADFTTNWEFWISPDDQMIYCSPSCERITGYSVADFVVNPQLLVDIIHPEDLPMYLEHKKQEMLAYACVHEIKFRIFRKDGLIRWIGHFCQPVFDELGLFKGIRGSNKDINARKEAEELLKKSNLKYSLLSSNITDGIFIFRDGYFEYVNRAMSHIFGYQGTELIGLGINHLILPEYAAELEFMQTSPPLNQKRSFEIDCLKKDHSIISVEFLFNYIATEKVIYGVAHDITDKKQIQRNIVKAIILTEEKERTYFSKELHDGLGPLLSTIKLYLEWSKEAKNKQSREEIVSKAEEIIEDSIRTVKEISNKLSPHILINFGLFSAIKSFVDKLKDTLSIKIELDCILSRRMDSEIEAAIYRAIIECINNTIKHSGAKNIKISLNDNGSQLLLRYLDDGIGFDINETIAMKKGFGLFNLQNRIQNIGGTIKLLSKPGKGVDYRIAVNI